MANEEYETPECLECLWPFLKLSRIFGICPVSRNGNELYTRNSVWWLSTLFSMVIQLVYIIKTIRDIWQSSSTIDQTVFLLYIILYHVQSYGNCLFAIWKAGFIPKFLENCTRIEAICKKYKKPKEQLIRNCILIFLFFIGMTIYGNTFYYIAEARKNDVNSVAEFFEYYNNDLLGKWGSYNTGIFFFFISLWCDMCWNFGDVFLALISIIQTHYFIRYNRELRRTQDAISVAKIQQLHREYSELSALVKCTNDMFSSFFLFTYVCNTTYLLIRLFVGLDDFSGSQALVWLESVNAIFSQFFVKILLPSCLAARLNEEAHEGHTLIQRWPSAFLERQGKYRLLVIGRFVSQFGSTYVGISAAGFFLISKTFLLTLISAMITYEIVILQLHSSTLAHSRNV